MSERWSSILLSLAAAAATGAIGAALWQVVDRGKQITGALRWGMYVPAGAVVVAWYLFVISWIGVTISAWVVVIPSALAIGVLGAARLRGSGGEVPAQAETHSIDRMTLLLGGVMAVLVAIWVQRVFTLPMHAWDALAIWGYKAKVICHETIGGTRYFQQGPSRSHLPYPLLVPLNMAWVAGFLGRFDDTGVRVIFPLMAGSVGLILYGGLRRFLRPAAALVLPVGLMATRAFGQRATYAEADITFAALALAAVVLVVEYSITGHGRFLALGAVMTAGAAFTKNEGLALLLVVAAAILLVGSARNKGGYAKRLLVAGLYGGLCLALLLPWLVFRSGAAQTDEHYLMHLRPSVVAANLNRLPTILLAIGASIVDVRDWLLIWPMVALGLVLLGKQAFKGPALLVLLILSGQLLAYVLIYVITPAALESQLRVTVDRLLLHLLPLACYAAGMGLGRTAALAGSGRNEADDRS